MASSGIYFVSGLLIWRIRRVLKLDTNSSGARQLQMLTRILMESGILYLSISIAHFVAYFCYDTFAIHMIGTLVSSCFSIDNTDD